MTGYNQEDTLDFKHIVMSALQKIFQISCSELKEQKKLLFQSSLNEPPELITEDTRISYAQSVEALGFLCCPYFDEDTESSFDKFYGVMNDLLSDYVENNKETLKEFFDKNEIDSSSNETKEKIEEFRKHHKVLCAKEVFYKLNFLLKSKSYFKTSIFSDVSEEELVDAEEEVE